jgi:hypothetical protein
VGYALFLVRSVFKVFAKAKSLHSRLAALAKPLAAKSVHPSETLMIQNLKFLFTTTKDNRAVALCSILS